MRQQADGAAKARAYERTRDQSQIRRQQILLTAATISGVSPGANAEKRRGAGGGRRQPVAVHREGLSEEALALWVSMINRVTASRTAGLPASLRNAQRRRPKAYLRGHAFRRSLRPRPPVDRPILAWHGPSDR
jgi:hypothetical protein